MATRANKTTKKRVPNPPKGSKGYKGRASKSSTSLSNSNIKKDANKTVFNSSVDNKLATVDVYQGNLGETVNSLYKFTNTMNLDTIMNGIKGGLSGIGKITDFLKDAKGIKDAFQSGNIMDAVGKIAPGAKAALSKAGIDPSTFDKLAGAAQIAVNVKNSVSNIKNGKLDILDGLNDLAKSITGQDLALIKDIQSIKAATGAIIKEFSDAGIALKDAWNDLTKSEKGRYNIADQIASDITPFLIDNGDYDTAKMAIGSIPKNQLEAMGPSIVENAIRNFRKDSVFNRGKKDEEMFNGLMDTLRLFRNGEYLWVDRGTSRKAFNMALFIHASKDLKEVIQAVCASSFYLKENGEKRLDYTDKKNDMLVLFNRVFTNIGNAEEEMNKYFPGFIFNKEEKTETLVSVIAFRAENSTR